MKTFQFRWWALPSLLLYSIESFGQIDANSYDVSKIFSVASPSVVSVNRHAYIFEEHPSGSFEYDVSEKSRIAIGSGVVVDCPTSPPKSYIDSQPDDEERTWVMEELEKGTFFERPCVITNCHVIGQSGPISVSDGNKSLEYRRKLNDYQSDLCMVETHYTVGERLGAPTAKIGSSTDLNVGDPVFAIGNPSGLTNTLTTGVVSSIRGVGESRLIQISAAISPGSSGGGVFNANGELIGLTTSKVVGAEGLGFAIPIELYDSLWEKDEEHRTKRIAVDQNVYRKAPLLKAHGSWEKLLTLSEQWVDINEWDRDAWYYLGVANAGLSRRKEAIAAFETAGRLDSTSKIYVAMASLYFVDFLVRDGSLSLVNSYYSTALDYLEKATAANPYDGEAWALLAMLYSHGDRPEFALSASRKSIELDPDQRHAWSACGKSYMDLGQYRKAYDCLLRATELFDIDPIDWWHLGLVAHRLGEEGTVFKAYKRLREMDSERADMLLRATE